MIILEFLAKLLVTLLFEGIILGFFRLIRKGYIKEGALVCGIKKSTDPIKLLEKKYLYKRIELISDLNVGLTSGLKGAIMVVFDTNRVFAEFYDARETGLNGTKNLYLKSIWIDSSWIDNLR